MADIALLTQTDYKMALTVQSASNLIAVINSFKAVLARIKHDVDGDSAAIRNHPIARLYAEQIAYLCNASFTENELSHETYAEAYKACAEMALVPDQALA